MGIQIGLRSGNMCFKFVQINDLFSFLKQNSGLNQRVFGWEIVLMATGFPLFSSSIFSLISIAFFKYPYLLLRFSLLHAFTTTNLLSLCVRFLSLNFRSRSKTLEVVCLSPPYFTDLSTSLLFVLSMFGMVSSPVSRQVSTCLNMVWSLPCGVSSAESSSSSAALVSRLAGLEVLVR